MPSPLAATHNSSRSPARRPGTAAPVVSLPTTSSLKRSPSMKWVEFGVRFRASLELVTETCSRSLAPQQETAAPVATPSTARTTNRSLSTRQTAPGAKLNRSQTSRPTMSPIPRCCLSRVDRRGTVARAATTAAPAIAPKRLSTTRQMARGAKPKRHRIRPPSTPGGWPKSLPSRVRLRVTAARVECTQTTWAISRPSSSTR